MIPSLSFVELLNDLQVVMYLRDPQGTQFRGLARPPKGVLLEGDPGVGKTLIAKAIAGEAGVPFFQVYFTSCRLLRSCFMLPWPVAELHLKWTKCAVQKNSPAVLPI